VEGKREGIRVCSSHFLEGPTTISIIHIIIYDTNNDNKQYYYYVFY
jgi:hypothetical protein